MSGTNVEAYANAGRKLVTAGLPGNRATRTRQSQSAGKDRDVVWVASDTVSNLHRLVSATSTSRHTMDVESAARRRQVDYVPRLAATEAQCVQGLEKWEGQVTAVDDGLFTADLVLSVGTETQRVSADFELSIIAEADRELVVPGAVFYCTVRTIVGPGGQPSRTSSIRMRRIGTWTEDALEQVAANAARDAEEIQALFE